MKKKKTLPVDLSDRLNMARKLVLKARNDQSTQLEIPRLGLTVLPEGIFELSALESLTIIGNPISAVPEEIFKLQKLRSLTIKFCRLQQIDPVILELKSLQHLNLDGNLIKEIPNELYQLDKLQSLSLNNNKISDIPVSIAQLKLLRRLHVVKNTIKELPEELLLMPTLSTIEFEDNLIPSHNDALPKSWNGPDLVPVLRSFIAKNRKTEENIFRHHIQIPEQFKTAFHQYLIYFNSFIKNVKGNDLKIHITDADNGLTISGQLDQSEQITLYLSEYLGFIREKVESIQPSFAQEVTNFDRRLLTIEIKDQVHHLTTQLEIKNMKIDMLQEQIGNYMSLLVLEKRSPQSIHIINTSNSNASAVSSAQIDFKQNLPELQTQLLNLKQVLGENNDLALRAEIAAIDEGIISIDNQTVQPEQLDKTPFRRLKRLIDILNDPESDWSKAIKASKKGIDTVQKLGRYYNKFASWLALPTIPEIFVK